MTAAAGDDRADRSASALQDSKQFRDGKFHNDVQPKQPKGREVASLWWQFMFKDTSKTVPPSPLTVQPLTLAQLAEAEDGSIYRLGHSTVLMKLHGGYWITDPVFSERASPVQWAGPKRFLPTPIALEALPPLEGVILSHDHFDHLDKDSVIALKSRAKLFLAPLGVGDHLIKWGIDADKVRQLDWWQSTQVGEMTFTATPAQHFSGRSLFSSNSTLWASWVIDTGAQRIYFSGDTGYFAGFAEIGRRFGPFAITLLEAGAYDKQWAGVHMLPEQVVQAHQDLRGERLLPIHNMTFDLAFHPWQEPMERILALASQHNIRLLTPRIGEAVRLNGSQQFGPWWRGQSERPEAAPASLPSPAST